MDQEAVVRSALQFLNDTNLAQVLDYDEKSAPGQNDTELADFVDNKNTRHRYYFHPYNTGPPWRPQVRRGGVKGRRMLE